MVDQLNTLTGISDLLADAVAKAAKSTVLVNGRHRLPASGIAYTAELVLTADHAVERDEDISVMTPERETLPAVVAGRDPGNDLALLRLNNAVLNPAEKSNLDGRVGQLVIALGRPGEDGVEASLGIISAIGGPARTGRGGLLERYLRTDTIPFPGFSGGPLVDTEGKVLGLNTSGLAHGAAITIPAFLAWADAENLAKYGYVRRSYLGIRSQQVELSKGVSQTLGREQGYGLLLVSVEKGSPAEAGGLIVGDILVAIDQQGVSDHDELMMHLSGDSLGRPISVQILRGGQPVELSVTAGERK